MKKPVRNVAASVRAQLLNISRAQKAEHSQTLTRFAIERLLYRLSLSRYRDGFLLKGAMLFVVWDMDPHRATRDLDLLGFGDVTPAAIRRVFEEVASISCPEDGILFDATTIAVSEIRAQDEYVGVRVTLRARLDGAVIPVQVDIGVGDAVSPEPSEVDFPALLDLPKARIRAYRVETVLAEKVHAMVTLGMFNTRMKDYFDVEFFARTRTFHGEDLVDAFRATFERRRLSPRPGEVVGISDAFGSDPAKQVQWRAFIEKSGKKNDLKSLGEVVSTISAFVSPVLEHIYGAGEIPARWSFPGPWEYLDG